MRIDRPLLLAVLATVAAGCFHFDPPIGVYSCKDGPCPDGLVCSTDHLCRSPEQEDCSALFVSPDGDDSATRCGTSARR
jgi:hypothetical protein